MEVDHPIYLNKLIIKIDTSNGISSIKVTPKLRPKHSSMLNLLIVKNNLNGLKLIITLPQTSLLQLEAIHSKKDGMVN